MTFNEYQGEAIKTLKPTCDKVYLASKLTIEAAEVAQPIIKNAYHDADIDYESVAEELGDLLWYAASLAHRCAIQLDDIAAQNIAKLRARHGDTYNAAHYTEVQP